MLRSTPWQYLAALTTFMLASLVVATHLDTRPTPKTLNTAGSGVVKPQLLDRHLMPITITYKNHWNIHNTVPLHEIPEFLQQAFIASEDKRFYKHNGADWLARLHALWQNIVATRRIRGASTISEQTIKMLHPRPRTIWTRWLEGIEAKRLEEHFSKNEILQFYLNQVPYSAQRRGVVQAARYYFGRDLTTLNQQEMLTLAVMVKAPSRLDPISHPDAAIPAINRLAATMELPAQMMGSPKQQKSNLDTRLTNASHYARYVYRHTTKPSRYIQTTLDLNLQNSTQKALEHRLLDLKKFNVNNGAVMIIDNLNNDILSWVVAGDGYPEYPGNAIDAVTTPRQPGSTLKPLLYALALENGFTAASLIDDSPLSESVGIGQHTYHNYSRRHYGPVSLREALGNSLNIPAIKTLQKIGIGKFLHTLHELGISSLQNHPDIYGDGLALGNGEITLYELVQAYSTLARQGKFLPLVHNRENTHAGSEPVRIFTKESTSLIAHILSDKNARKREFGSGGLLDLPVQTAIKTGTSSDYRDAWAVGFNHRYTVGVWMGNMDRQSMNKVTGSSGPAHVLRSVFSTLNIHKLSRALYLSPELTKATVCKETGRTPEARDKACTPINEWFIENTDYTATISSDEKAKAQTQTIRIQHPGPNLQMAMDPRIPNHKEYFRFSLNQQTGIDNVKWMLDGRPLATTSEAHVLWQIEKGEHKLSAIINKNRRAIETGTVAFLVK